MGDNGIVKHNPRDLLKAVAMDIGKEVAHHIETMYPEAVEAASSTFLLSVRNCVHNEILAAIESDWDVAKRIEFRTKFRRKICACYKGIRKNKRLKVSTPSKERSSDGQT